MYGNEKRSNTVINSYFQTKYKIGESAEKGLEQLKEIKEIQDSLKTDEDTGYR